MEKLDSFSKILLATSTINYLANTISVVNYQIKGANHSHPETSHVFAEGIKHKDELLLETVKKLGEIMNDLGDCLNNCDATMPIDELITSAAFNIIVGEKDDTDTVTFEAEA